MTRVRDDIQIGGRTDSGNHALEPDIYVYEA